VVCITLWGIGCTLLFFIPLTLLGWVKYHPVIELLGAGRFKMGEITSTFINEIRRFAKHDGESSSGSPKSDKNDIKFNVIDEQTVKMT
jgi:hypothetical protein